MTFGRQKLVAWCVNTSNSDPQACYILTDELALGVDIPESSEIVIVRDGTVEDVQSGCANFRTPSGAVAMVLNSGCYVRGMARVGMRAEYGFCVTDGDSDMENMKNIIGGTGMIVEHGVSAVDNNPNVTADDQDRTAACLLDRRPGLGQLDLLDPFGGDEERDLLAELCRGDRTLVACGAAADHCQVIVSERHGRGFTLQSSSAPFQSKQQALLEQPMPEHRERAQSRCSMKAP